MSHGLKKQELPPELASRSVNAILIAESERFILKLDNLFRANKYKVDVRTRTDWV